MRSRVGIPRKKTERQFKILTARPEGMSFAEYKKHLKIQKRYIEFALAPRFS